MLMKMMLIMINEFDGIDATDDHKAANDVALNGVDDGSGCGDDV